MAISCVRMQLSSPVTFVTVPELQGEPEDISKERERLAAKEINGPVLVEDTCLCFNALKGLPGLNLLAGYEDKSAYALCVLSLALGPLGMQPLTFVGRAERTIVSRRGPGEFGWDPVYQPEGYELTFAEMLKEEENKISHRWRALNKAREHFYANNYVVQNPVQFPTVNHSFAE